MKKFIVVAGNIGVGKSTLVSLLSEKLNWQPFYEPEGDNPYLADFYLDMRQWAFHSQVFFLARRLQTHRQVIEHSASAIQDRSVYEDAEIFAANLYHQELISARDYHCYVDLYRGLTAFLPPPDLVIYLRASVQTLMERIAQRGRGYESEIHPDYLGQLNGLYDDWVSSFSLCPVLTVPADNLNYVAQPAHLDLIVRKVQEKLTGKDEVVFHQDEMQSDSQI